MKRSAGEDLLELASNPEKVVFMRMKLLNWFAKSGRHQVPWKLKEDGTLPKSREALSPYGIWIAEVMLQQTQFKVALPYWEKWMQAFPTLMDLAHASEQEVLLLWQGLGYYSRARRLLQAAKHLLVLIGDEASLDPALWPKDKKTWIALPGIGRTTAGSIISSAFDLPGVILDGNVKRVLGRLFINAQVKGDSIEQLWDLSEKLLDKQHPRQFNQALMDLGSIVCKPRNPHCCNCPWNGYCIVYSSKQAKNFEVKHAGKILPFQVIGVGIVFNAAGQVLIDQRLEHGLLGGMWEFPGGKQEPEEDIEETIIRELKEELAIEVEVGEQLISLEHSYTHKKLCFIVHICMWKSGEPQPLESQQCLWVNPSDLMNYPFPAANSKIISALNKYLQKDKSI